MEPLPPPLPGVVDADRPCLGCGYNLRNLGVDGQCPECGSPVERSLRGNLLEFASREYVANLRRGCTLVEIGVIAEVLGGIAVFGLAAAVAISRGALIKGGAMPSMAGMPVEQINSLVEVGASLVAVLGWWLLSNPDPAMLGPDADTRVRRVLRVLLLVGAATAIGSLLMSFVPGMARGVFSVSGIGNSSFSPALIAATLFGIAALLVKVGLIFAKILFLRHLAERIPSAGLLATSRIYIWLIPVLSTVGIVLCGLGPLLATIFFTLYVDKYRKELGAVLARMEPETPPA